MTYVLNDPHTAKTWLIFHYTKIGNRISLRRQRSIFYLCLLYLKTKAPVTYSIFVHTMNTLRPRKDGRQFGRRYFQMQFRQWKCVNFDTDFTELCSWGFNSQYVTIGSGNGLAPNRRNDNPVQWYICVTRPQWVNFADARSSQHKC